MRGALAIPWLATISAAAAADPAPALDCAKLGSALTSTLHVQGTLAETCVAGRFAPGVPGVFVWARGFAGDALVERTGVVQPDGTVAIAAHDEPASSSVEEGPPRLRAADLDGDGVDEIVEEWPTDRHAIGARLAIARLAHGVFATAIGPWIALDDSGFARDPPTRCAGTLAIEPTDHPDKRQRLVLTVTRAVDPGHQCLAKGRHVLILGGGKIVEAP